MFRFTPMASRIASPFKLQYKVTLLFASRPSRDFRESIRESQVSTERNIYIRRTHKAYKQCRASIMFKILPFTYGNDETDRILFNTNYSNIQNAVEHEEFGKTLFSLRLLSILLMTHWKIEMFRFAQLTVALLLSSILVSRQYSHWSASLLETTNWFRLKKNLQKCGNFCESPLLPIIQNFDDPVLLPFI